MTATQCTALPPEGSRTLTPQTLTVKMHPGLRDPGQVVPDPKHSLSFIFISDHSAFFPRRVGVCSET